MAAGANKNGAIADSVVARNFTGALSTGVGIGSVHAGPAQGFALNTDTTTAIDAIGGTAIDVQSVEASGITGKNLKYLQASAGVAVDGVVATGWLNKTGRALTTGEFVWAQEL